MIALATEAPVSSVTYPVIVIFLPDFCPDNPLKETNTRKMPKNILTLIFMVLNYCIKKNYSKET